MVAFVVAAWVRLKLIPFDVEEAVVGVEIDVMFIALPVVSELAVYA